MAQPLKKKDVKGFSLKGLKSNMGIAVETPKDIEKSNADKEIEWITLPEAYQEAVKLPGIPMGYMSGVRGWSDTGKSTIKNCLIAEAMRMGILPVIFETEGNFDFNYARDCGMNVKPVYGDVEEEDEETGEVKLVNKIIDWEGDYVLFTNNTICEFCGDMDYSQGKKVSKKRKVACIEDIQYIMNTFLDKQDDGEIPMPILFVWDSVGSIPCYKAITSKSFNAQWDAAALSQSFKTLVNNRIPNSRQVGQKYTNTFFYVNKVWNDAMNSMGGAPSIENSGGKAFFYATRLGLHVGGVAKPATKKLKATLKGEEYQYGIVTKIGVYKNQLPSPFNITYNGTMCCVHNGLVSENKLDEYKKKSIPEIMARMKQIHGENAVGNAKADEISFEEEGTLEE